MKRWPVKLHHEATSEIKEAVRWYREISSSLANDYSAALDIAMDRIARSPHRWPIYIDDFRQVLFDRFPYVVIYRVRGDEVQVLAVAHTKRQPGYWLGRT